MEESYILNHLGEDRENYYNAVIPPIIQTSNFAFNSVAEFRSLLKDEMNNPLYSRGSNPTVNILRKKLAALSGAEDAWLFSSGSGAIAATVIAFVSQGDHIICIKKPYSWTNNLLSNLLSKFGVETTFIDGTDIANFESAIRPETKVIMLESPNSLTFELQDLKAVADLARSKSITTIIDNSYCSPLYQKVIDMGIDVSVHTISKYIGGHSDVVAGVVCSSEENIRRIFRSEYMTLGATISPNDAWLILRSMRTLRIRLEQINEHTKKVVSFLENHPLVEKMHYPFSESHPQYDLAKSQMKEAPGLFSILLKTSEVSAVDAFVDALQIFIMAVSWGGYESLVFPMSALVEAENYSADDKPFNLVRLYVGLDHPDELIKDLERGFAAMSEA